MKAAQIVSEQDIGYALELKRRLEAAQEVIANRFLPIQRDLTQLGLNYQESWVTVVETMAQGVTWASELYGWLKDIPDIFARVGNSEVFKRWADSAVRSSGMLASPEEAAASGVDPQRQAAVARLTALLRNHTAVQDAMRQSTEIATRVQGDQSKAIEKTAKAATEARSAYDRAVESVQRNTAVTLANAKSVGLSAGEQARLRTEAILTEAAMREGGTAAVEKHADEIRRLSEAAGAAAEGYARAQEALKRFREEQRFIGESLRDAIGSALDGDSAEDIGKRFGKKLRDAMLDALLTGGGPLAGMLGLNASQPGQQGGLFGMLAGNDVPGLKSLFSDAFAGGIKQVWGSGGAGDVGPTLEMAGRGAGVGGMSNLARGAMGAMAFYGAYAGATPNAGMSAANGALSGAAGGAMLAPMLGVAGPVGLIGGAILGGVLGFMGSNQAKRAQEQAAQKQAREAWDSMRADFGQFVSVLSGKGQGTLSGALEEARANTEKFRSAAQKAGDVVAVIRLDQAFAEFQVRKVDEFRRSIDDLMESFNAGLGADGPVMKGRDTVRQALETVKGFVADVKTAVGVVEQANSGPSLSGFMEQMGPAMLSPGLVGSMFMFSMEQAFAQPVITPEQQAQIDAAREAGRNQLLTLLSGAKEMSAIEQAMAVLNGTASELQSALTQLGFSADQAAADISGRLAGAIAKLRQEFEKGLERDINSATGKGYINELQDLIGRRDVALADAGRLGTSTALVDRWFKNMAQRIVDDANLVGDAFDDFIALFPNLTGVVTESTEALEAQIEEQKRLRDSIKGFLDSLKLNSNLSTLSPAAQLAEAERVYNERLGLAQGGDTAAQASITQAAQQLLEIARGFYGPSTAFGAIFDRVNTQLTALTGVLGGGMMHGGIVGAYAGGGMVGNGIWNQDSVLARYAGGGNIALAGGEYVMPAPQTAANLAALQAMHAGGGSNDNGALLAELRALRKEVNALRAERMRGDATVQQATAQVAGEVRGLRTDVTQVSEEQRLRKAG